ncbi:MAG: hypothetical protein J7L44_00060 [Candidatus Diapherotrites archaeon]|nr:hypothetical protein [Candidatus Diapherotrites archaeon]
MLLTKSERNGAGGVKERFRQNKIAMLTTFVLFLITVLFYLLVSTSLNLSRERLDVAIQTAKTLLILEIVVAFIVACTGSILAYRRKEHLWFQPLLTLIVILTPFIISARYYF